MSIPASGITPAASFELAGFEPQKPPPVILADKIDPSSGEFLSLTTGYAVADGLALHLLTVQRDSGAVVRGRGQRFREVRHLDERSPELLRSLVREALQPGIDSGTLRIERVTSTTDELDDTQNETVVEYKDMLAVSKDPNRRLTVNP